MILIFFFLEKLRLFGVKSNSITWFKSYLTARIQRCKVNGFLSKEKPISCGVPRRSISGPLFFLIYINDLPYSLNCGKARLHAYDTNLTITASCYDNLEKVELRELRPVNPKESILINIYRGPTMV